MNMLNQMSPEEVKKLLDRFPEIQKFQEEAKTIEELVSDLENETNSKLMSDGFKCVMRLQTRLHVKMLNYYIGENSKNFNSISKLLKESQSQCQQISDMLRDEKTANKEFFEQICFVMFSQPSMGYQMLLNFVERQEKIEDPTGDSWEWALKFKFIHRIKIAFKMIFGRSCLE